MLDMLGVVQWSDSACGGGVGTFAVSACWSMTSGRRMLARLAITGSDANARLSLTHTYTQTASCQLSALATRQVRRISCLCPRIFYYPDEIC